MFYSSALLILACLYVLASAADIQDGHWVTSWTAVPQASEANKLPSEFYQEGIAFSDSTIRQTLRMTIGAEEIRFRISNAFGQADLPVTKVTVANPWADSEHDVIGSGSIDPESLTSLTFGGDESVIIPAGALAVSDPITFPTESGQVLSVSVYLREGQATEDITTHRISRTDSWLASGEHTESTDIEAADAKLRQSWYFISAVEAWQTSNFKAFCIMGDSLTDGTGSTMNADARWPNFLFDRMQETSSLQDVSVLNQGASGNRELSNGLGGVNAVSRIDRDLLALSGLRYAMLFEGINDVAVAPKTEEGQAEVAERLIQYYKQTITRVHTFGIPVFGSTLLPINCESGSDRLFGNPILEQTRLRLNDWIRTSGWLDAVIDFDEVIRDESNHTRVNVSLNSGDCLHPNDEGYRRMAEAFPLELFEKFRYGVDRFGQAADHASSQPSRPFSNGTHPVKQFEPGLDPSLTEDKSWVPKTISVVSHPISTYVFGFFSCALLFLALRRCRGLSWSRRTPLRHHSPDRFKIGGFEDEEDSAMELLEPREFERDHSR